MATNQRDVPISKLSVGDYLPGFFPWIAEQRITEYQPYLKNGDEYRFRIVTNGPLIDGEFPTWDLPLSFSRSPLNMPMRPDGSTRQWYDLEPPKVIDLRSGDELRSGHVIVRFAGAGGRPPKGPPDVGESYRDGFVVVTKFERQLYRTYAERHFTAKDLMTGNPATYVNTIEETEYKFKNPHGPYVVLDVKYFLYEHPYGRGRWPAHIPPFEFVEKKAFFKCRPPLKNEDWAELRYEGPEGKRHPQDPVELRRRSAMRRATGSDT